MPKISLINQSDIQIKNKQYTDAIITCDLILKKEKNKSALYNKGRAYLGLKEYSKAIEIFEEYIRNYPSDAGAYCELARAYEQKGNFQEAKNNYQLANQRYANYTDAINGYQRVSQILQDQLPTRISHHNNNQNLEQDDFTPIGEEEDQLTQKRAVCELFNERLYIVLENIFALAKTGTVKIMQAETASPVSTSSKIANVASTILNPVLGVAVNAVSIAASAVAQEQQLQHLTNLGFLLTREEAEKIAHIVSNEITRRYAHSLSRINIFDFNQNNANTLLVKFELAENNVLDPLIKFTLVKVVEYILNRTKPFSKKTLADDLIKAICEASPTVSDLFKKVIGLDELTTFEGDKFSATEFYSAHGIMLANNDAYETYVNDSTNPKIYGYRLGTTEEIHSRNDLKSELTPQRQGIFPELFEGYFAPKEQQEKTEQLDNQKLTQENNELKQQVNELSQNVKALSEELKEARAEREEMKKQLELFQKFMLEQQQNSSQLNFSHT